MDWAKIILLVLQLVDKLIDYVHDQKLIDQGRQEEISKQALIIASKVSSAKKIMEQINAMSPGEVDQALRDLEPPSAGGTGGKS